MFNYKHIECKCGQQARIVESAIGTYIRCPYCEAGTYMCSTTEQALEKFRETGGKEDERDTVSEIIQGVQSRA